MKRSPFVLLLALMLVSLKVASAQYNPQTGPEALRQRALDAKSRLNVLSLSLQPGYEDLSTLAYFRLGLGARVVSAFVTNGEAGESDVKGEYPNFLAATRRREAAAAMAALGGEEYFLNMTDFGAASDTAVVGTQWNADTLRMRLEKLLTELRPDVILIARDCALQTESPKQTFLLHILLRTLRKLEPTKAEIKAGGADEMFRWNVDRVLVETGSAKGMRVAVNNRHPLWKKSYAAIGEEAGDQYESLKFQRRIWYGSGNARRSVSYEWVYPVPARKLKSVDDALPREVPGSIRGIDKEIRSLCALLESGTFPSSERLRTLVQLSAVIDSVDELLSRPLDMTSQSRKICMQWKLTLENLRTSLLGIVVKFRIDPMIVTERQVTLLSIDSIAGTQPGDSLWIYFPFAGQWFVDESSTKLMAVRLHDYYRLLSPMTLEHDLPAAREGLSQPTIGKTLPFFIMGKSKTREHNFIYRCSPRLQYSDRFSTETLTPIVRALPGEKVVVRLTNHSRDGVRDSVVVDDSLAYSDKKEFRINTKDVWVDDTLTLQWKRELPEGTYIVPVNIESKEVSKFAARKISVRTDPSGKIALITGISASPTAETLRRLGLPYKEIRNASSLAQQLGGSTVVVVDRRAMSQIPDLASQGEVLRHFAESGGHLLILAQDADVWNAAPVVEGLRLEATDKLEEAFEVEGDEHGKLWTSPNQLTWQDWEFWLFRRAYNIVSGPALKDATVLLQTKREKNPLIADWNVGSGRITYVDLALQQQFLNVHPGSFRLLANLLAY
ncbi:MAG TPA: PIG-L family deacetylase [Bacteroidota bacterium]|nr:PIG-L family deacetylase [Bacteroidota bacterium]